MSVIASRAVHESPANAAALQTAMLQRLNPKPVSLCVAFLLYLAGCGHVGGEGIPEEMDLPALVVRPGETVEIAARLHQFESIHVMAGGTLRIRPRSARWTILWTTGDVRIEGEIVGTQFARSAGLVREQTPDGKWIEHQFSGESLGGRGGSGGTASQLGAGSRNGGSGGNGTALAGGGGGSGGGIHIQGDATRLGGPGNSASDWRGAPPPDGGYANRGGDGARLSSHPNGALLMIYAGGTFRGSGHFRLTGDAGANGANGGAGANSNRGRRGGGGGGGGAPGGEGGRLLLVAGEFENDPVVTLSGGAGGQGGRAGQPAFHAEPGQPGEPGSEGYLDVLTHAQWQAN